MSKEYVTEFKDYRDLPFSKEIQDCLFNKHYHEEGTEKIIYTEADVLIMLQMVVETTLE